MKPADIDFDRLLKRLNLANPRRVWRDLIARAEAQQWSFHDFLATLVAEEIAQRSHTRLGRLSHRAQFPFLKTIDEFDFTYQSTLRLALLGSALSADFFSTLAPDGTRHHRAQTMRVLLPLGKPSFKGFAKKAPPRTKRHSAHPRAISSTLKFKAGSATLATSPSSTRTRTGASSGS